MKTSSEKDDQQTLSEFSFESIAIYENGQILNYNDNFIQTFGYEESNIRGMSLFHFFPKIYRILVNNKAIPNQGERRIETICVRKDSSTFPAEVRIKSINYQNRVLNAVAVRDDSDRKTLENELLKSTIFQKAILDSANFSIISTDFNGLVKTFNKGAEKMFRLKAEEIVELKNIVQLHLESELVNRAMELTMETKRQIPVGFEVFVEKLKTLNVDENEWTYVRNDHTSFDALVTVTPLKDRFDEITGYLFTGIDISDKKKAEAEIIDKSQILNGIITHMPVFVFKLDEKGNIVQIIGNLLQELYFKTDDLTGVNIIEAYPETKANLEKAYSGETVTFIQKSTVENQEFYFEYYVFPDQTRPGSLIGLALNISERIRFEQKLKRSADNLLKINNELDQFAYIVSHDLKAPLRAIENLSQWIEDDLGENISGDVRKNMGLMRDRVVRMQNLIDGILNYSRIGRTKSEKEEVNLYALVKETTTMVDAIDKFKVEISKKLPVIHANKTLMEQIFINLISNAVKYHHRKQGTITINYQEDTQWHIFSVADDGPGIHPDYHEKIFMIFQTLQSKDIKGSTGIGLTIVKKIVEDQGGSVKVESDGRSGSKFIFTLPKK